MRYIILLFTTTLLLSCKSKIANINNEEILIVNHVLILSKSNYEEINLLSKPNNELVETFKNGGFQDDDFIKYNYKFNFKNDKIIKWTKSISLGNKKIQGKLNFIKDFNKIEKVSSNEIEKSKVIHSISNVMFSDDGKYAIVNINTFSNFIVADYYEGRIYIFKKEGDKWVYVSDFMAAVS